MENDGFIDDLTEALTNLNLQTVIGDSLEKTKGEITEYQKGQMLHGLNSDGKIIGKYKNPDYARRKTNMNPAAGYGIVDLKDKGEFQRNIKTTILSSSVEITSSDSKTKMLEDKYNINGDIFGLDEEYAGEYVELYLEPEIDQNINEQL